MKQNHTLGPWQRNIKPATKYPTVFAGRNTHVCHLASGLPEDETEANMRLICASPDLLSACEAAEQIISAIECGHDKPLSTGQALDQLRKALSKARS